MVTGQKTLHAIDTAIVKARNDASKASLLPAKLSGQLVAVRREEAQALGDMARLRLELIASGDDEDRLGYVDRQAEKLLAAHERSQTRLINKIAQIETKITGLEAQRRAQEKAVIAAINAYDKAAAACQKALLADPDYIETLTKVETLEAQAARAQSKLDVALQDEQDKGAVFRDDAFFSYLQKRRYKQKDAKGWFLTKMLDGWIAQLCDYQTAAVNYKRLQAIPARLDGHVDNLDAQAEGARTALKQAEEAMLISRGVEQMRKASLLAQTKLEKLDAKIADAEDTHLAATQEQSALTSGAAGPYAEAMTLLSDTLSRKDLPSLSVLAAQTVSRDDDRAVSQMGSLREQASDLESNQASASKLLSKYQQSLKELEAVRRKFKQNRYDAPYSQFPSGDLIGALLGQVLIGALSGESLWGQIARAQRTVQRNTDIDFGGIDWGEAMRIPRSSRSSRNSGRNSGWGGTGGIFGNTGSRSSSRSRPQRSRTPTIRRSSTRSAGRKSGGFRTGGGF